LLTIQKEMVTPMNKNKEPVGKTTSNIAKYELGIKNDFITRQIKSLNLYESDLKNYTLVSQSNDSMISKRMFLKHKNDNWSNYEQTWAEDHARAERYDDALTRASAFINKHLHDRGEANSPDEWKSYFLHQKKLEHLGEEFVAWYRKKPEWYDRKSIKRTDMSSISLFNAIALKFISPAYVFDGEITVVYKIIGKKVYILEIENGQA